jgi:hypothetical protein
LYLKRVSKFSSPEKDYFEINWRETLHYFAPCILSAITNLLSKERIEQKNERKKENRAMASSKDLFIYMRRRLMTS